MEEHTEELESRIVEEEYISRNDALAIVGVSYPTFRKRIDGVLATPIIDSNGRVKYRKEEIIKAKSLFVNNRIGRPRNENSKLVQQNVQQNINNINNITIKEEGGLHKLSAKFTGDMASSVFKMLDEGLSAIEIVQETDYHPDAVKSIIYSWTNFKEGFFVDKKVKDAIERLFLNSLIRTTPKQLKSQEDLIDNLKIMQLEYMPLERFEKEVLCKGCVNACKSSPKRATLCEWCAKKQFVGNP